MEDAVLATRLGKRYQAAKIEVFVLQEVSFRVTQGSSAALLGQARSGKTTLIKMLAGLENISTGNLSVFGKGLESLTERDLATYRREVVGLVSPEVPWLPQFSLEDNVALPLLIANVPRREAKKRVAEMCAWLGLSNTGLTNTGLTNTMHLGSLTPLEQGRWALARALIHGPKLLLVDNLEHLDDEAEPFIAELLEKTSEQGLTVMFTTRQALIAAYAEQIFTLRESRLQTSEVVLGEPYVATVCGN
jgi:ABC-type lipoprotein export system ATPase subunit